MRASAWLDAWRVRHLMAATHRCRRRGNSRGAVRRPRGRASDDTSPSGPQWIRPSPVSMQRPRYASTRRVTLPEPRGSGRRAGRRARARPGSGAALSGPAAIVDGDLPALAGCRGVPALAGEMIAGPRRIHHSMRRPRCQGGGGGADDPHQNAAVRRRCGGGWARRLRRPGSYSAAVPVPSPSVIFQITPRSDTSRSPSAVKMIPSGLVNPRSATIDTSPSRVTLMTRS